MAIQYPVFSGSDYEAGSPDLAKSIQSGLQNFISLNEGRIKANEAKYAPKMSEADLKAKALSNAINEVKAKYAPQMGALDLQLKQGDVGNIPLQRQLLQAQIQKALRGPQPQLSNYEKALEGYYRIAQKYGENSREAKEARDNATRISQGSSGLQFSYDPNTHVVNFSQGGRNQPTSQIVTDEQGNSYLVNKPTTPTTTATQKGSLANFVRQNLAKNFKNPYVGTGSNYQLTKDRYDYAHTSDPIKKKEIGERLINAALSLKLVPEYASLQLLAQGTTPSVESLREQKAALTQGYAEGLPIVVNNLPKELQEEVSKRHDKAIKELSQKREQYISQGMPIPLNKKNNEQNNKKNEQVIDYVRDASGRLVPANRG